MVKAIGLSARAGIVRCMCMAVQRPEILAFPSHLGLGGYLPAGVGYQLFGTETYRDAAAGNTLKR
ncbi:MAG: hypothetical protein MUF80_10445, partial [Burkholderiales bacterium]|nr:hypothetical protein [Burkholderiales bacterium]